MSKKKAQPPSKKRSQPSSRQAQPPSGPEPQKPSGRVAQPQGQEPQPPTDRATQPPSEAMAPTTFGPSLREYLQARIIQSGLTPAEIARRANIAPALLYRFVNEQRDLSLETIDKILPVIDREIGANM